MPGHLDVIEIPSAFPITVALGGNNDIVIAQLHDDGRRASVYFDVQHANAIAAAILTLARTSVEGDARTRDRGTSQPHRAANN